jgi:hypothetical protein
LENLAGLCQVFLPSTYLTDLCSGVLRLQNRLVKSKAP